MSQRGATDMSDKDGQNVCMSLDPGSVFAGYVIERLIGVGGMGSVYLARHPNLPRLDALKLLNPEFSVDHEFAKRFLREGGIVAGLSHRHILPVHDRGSYNGQLWFSMPYVQGRDAEEAVSASPKGMPAELAVHIVEQVGSALDYAHRQHLLHRDVKPANILLAPPDEIDEMEWVFLTDFGIAKSIDEVAALTVTGSVIATFVYASPEQIEGKQLDHRTDIYSLGCVLHRLLTGSVPYPAASIAAVINGHLHLPQPRPSTLVPGLQPSFDEVVAVAMAKIPADRYQSCRALAAAAKHALDAGGQATIRNLPATTRSEPRPSNIYTDTDTHPAAHARIPGQVAIDSPIGTSIAPITAIVDPPPDGPLPTSERPSWVAFLLLLMGGCLSGIAAVLPQFAGSNPLIPLEAVNGLAGSLGAELASLVTVLASASWKWLPHRFVALGAALGASFYNVLLCVNGAFFLLDSPYSSLGFGWWVSVVGASLALVGVSVALRAAGSARRMPISIKRDRWTAGGVALIMAGIAIMIAGITRQADASTLTRWNLPVLIVVLAGPLAMLRLGPVYRITAVTAVVTFGAVWILGRTLSDIDDDINTSVLDWYLLVSLMAIVSGCILSQFGRSTNADAAGTRRTGRSWLAFSMILVGGCLTGIAASLPRLGRVPLTSVNDVADFLTLEMASLITVLAVILWRWLPHSSILLGVVSGATLYNLLLCLSSALDFLDPGTYPSLGIGWWVSVVGTLLAVVGVVVALKEQTEPGTSIRVERDFWTAGGVGLILVGLAFMIAGLARPASANRLADWLPVAIVVFALAVALSRFGRRHRTIAVTAAVAFGMVWFLRRLFFILFAGGSVHYWFLLAPLIIAVAGSILSQFGHSPQKPELEAGRARRVLPGRAQNS